ncbi:MAG: tetratricopeptide repeat protein [Planctomycetota bacterium]|jgi:tetratricopeptide (TPR) repeat protein
MKNSRFSGFLGDFAYNIRAGCMNRLLEIFGKAITVDTPELIWHWFGASRSYSEPNHDQQQQQIEDILGLIADARHDLAEEQLRLYLFDNPDCIKGRLLAAAFCLSKNDLENAVIELNSVYMRQPSNTVALYALGHCYERLGAEAQAIEFYQDCLKFKKYLQLPRQRLAAIYFKNSQLEKTIAQYQVLAEEYTDDISSLLILGYLYIAVKKYDQAVDVFNKAILIHPDNFDDDYAELDEMINNGLFNEALDYLENLAEQYPDRPDILLRQADVLSKIGTEEDALDIYHQVVQMRPDYLEATIKLGTQYLQMGKFSHAAMQFNKAVEINDKVVDAYIGLAIAQKFAGHHSEALNILSLASTIQPNTAVLFAETATLQFMIQIEERLPVNQPMQTPPELIEDVIKAHRVQIAQNPQNPDLHYRLAVLMMCVGRISEAIKEFSQALEINPAFTRARSKLVVCLFEIGHEEQALNHMILTGSLSRETLDLHYKTALLYCDKIKFASSMLNLEKNMQENYASSDTTVNISIILQNLGMLDRALVMWENLIDTTNQAVNYNNHFYPE